MANEGAGGGGKTSVSYDGSTLFSENRLETLVRFPLPTLNADIFTGDFRGDLRGDLGEEFVRFVEVIFERTGEVGAGTGVPGSSASIISTFQERFSSWNSIRSACHVKQ
jgi:hypothetical protein